MGASKLRAEKVRCTSVRSGGAGSIFNSWYLTTDFCYTGSITPTVELNGLAMKRGEPAIYRPLDPKPMPNYRANYNFRGMFNQRWAPKTELPIAVKWHWVFVSLGRLSWQTTLHYCIWESAIWPKCHVIMRIILLFSNNDIKITK